MPTMEARTHIAEIAGPLRLGENVKAALARVARATGLGPRRIRGIWNGEARSIRADEMDRLRQAARDARLSQEAHDELRIVLSRLAACEAALGLSASHDAGAPAPELGGAPRGLDRTLGGGR